MFGDLKNKMEQGKKDLVLRMNNAYVRVQSPSKLIEIIANGNKSIVDIKVDKEIYEDTEQFEDELIIVINNALEQADLMFQEELKAVMKDQMPNIPGLEGLLD